VTPSDRQNYEVENAEGQGAFLLVCDHASNRIPERYAALGLSPNERVAHIAWDPGALAIGRELGRLLDAPLIHTMFSRLVIDCNRSLEAADLIPATSEDTGIPGNADLGAEEIGRRISEFHEPYHRAIDALLDRRAEEGRQTIVVAVHTFTPVYRGTRRPWRIGIIQGANSAFSRRLDDALSEDDDDLEAGWNEPYSAADGVTYTLERHADRRGLEGTMIEVRNDEVLEPQGVHAWARRLARCLNAARQALGEEPASTRHEHQ
jgi:predicted N-formylglutamate amidohydrolase